MQEYSYDYDDIGNREEVLKQSHEATKQIKTEVYQSNLLNQYEKRETMHDEQLVQTNYHHDADGNLLQDGKWTYQWNAEKRLIALESQVGEPLQRLEFRYDPQGRRILKEVYIPKWNEKEENKN